MSSFGFRPHFSEVIDLSPEEAQARIIAELERADCRCEVKSFPGFVALRVPPDERHFWSPRLTLSLDPAADGRTRVTGIYGPNANVWSMFLYGYLGVGSLGLFSGLLGLVQWKLERPAWGMWVFGLMCAAAAGLYVLAQFGQKLAAAQTFRLHHVFESAMGRMVQIR